MVRMKCKTRFHAEKVAAAARRGNFKSLGHAAAAIRLTARRSIRPSRRASAPGRPPHTRRGLMKRAILYAVEPEGTSAVVGPDAAFVGGSAQPHEFGGRYKGQEYPRRPFMGPALEQVRDRLPRHWAASVR
jgi:hypothetical protein